MSYSHQSVPQDEAQQGLGVLAGRWDLRLGYHPALAHHLPMLAQLPLFPTVPQQAVLNNLDLPVTIATHGHHVMQDAGYITAATPPGALQPPCDEYPLAPVFVRDLCGRTIHTGLNPLPAAPSIPVFPSGCQHVPSTHPAAALVENALFLTYRRIECAASFAQSEALATHPDLTLRALVARPQTYAYKLRPDTFYADGWRLPQVVRVFAKPESPTTAQTASEELMQRWQSRPAGQDYEAFYDANNGDEWFESLFEKGCTVIPTLEAYNGRYHVADDYTATAVDPGRAVPGLHEVLRREPSDLPEGTILSVEEPGWVTATLIQPARVVVSDGSGAAPSAAPLPQLPNLNLPHPRLGGQWGAVWLPTHPDHFAEPALYDWDASGHFVQVSGPLWDPLHYVYSCTSQLVRAARKPLPQAPGLYVLPESLKARFHPVVALMSYDTHNQRTAQQRTEDPAHALFGCGIDTVAPGGIVTPVGYHPLPWALEYELDPAHLPTLHPRHRVSPCPASLQERIVPLAVLQEDADTYLRYQVIVTEPQRAAMAEATSALRDDAACDANGTLLPQQWQAAAQLTTRALPSWLPEIPASQLAINVKRLFAARTYRQALQQAALAVSQPQLPAAFFQFREAALAWRRLRYRLFGKYPATWQQAVLEGLNLTTAEVLITNHTADDHAIIRSARQRLLGVTPAPVPEARNRSGGLPFQPTPANLAAKRRSPARQGPAKGKSAPDNPPKNPRTNPKADPKPTNGKTA